MDVGKVLCVIRRVPGLRIKFVRRIPLRGAGGIYEDIDRAELGFGFARHSLRFIRLHEIGDNRCDFAELCCRLIQVAAIARYDGNPGAFVEKGACAGEPYSLAAAGDQDRAIFQTEFHICLFVGEYPLSLQEYRGPAETALPLKQIAGKRSWRRCRRRSPHRSSCYAETHENSRPNSDCGSSATGLKQGRPRKPTRGRKPTPAPPPRSIPGSAEKEQARRLHH